MWWSQFLQWLNFFILQFDCLHEMFFYYDIFRFWEVHFSAQVVKGLTKERCLTKTDYKYYKS